MDLGSHKIALIIIGSVLLLIVTVAVFSSVWPKQEEWFFELGLLGKDKTADAYFADAHSIVDEGAVNNWFIYVHNHMGSSESIKLRVKLLNSTMDLPDDKANQPSPAASFAEFPLLLSVNETMLVPFSWSVIEAEMQNGSTVIKRLLVNNQPSEVRVSDSVTSFVAVFELWVHDRSSGEYQFRWHSKNGFSSASVYMEFKLNYTSK